MPRLLVIVPDRISVILAKGEYQPGYYNPGGVFDEVHILMTNDDRPSLEQLQRTVGQARLIVHNYSDDLNLVGKRPGWLAGSRLRHWAKAGIELVRRIGPDMIRCHGADWNTYLASRIKAELGIPYVVSLHINPDINPVRRYNGSDLTPGQVRHNKFYEYLEGEGLRNADLVMPVYKPILPYLERLGVQKVEVCYNVLNTVHLRQKDNYALSNPARVLYVGRLVEEKDPANIILAIANMQNVALTIVGDGPIRSRLEALVAEMALNERVHFLPAVPNDKLCELLTDSDIFAVHTEHWEISKAVLEAVLTGLPVIINRRIGDAVPEFEEGDFLCLVDNTVQDYRAALDHLLTNSDERAALGRRAFDHSQARWAPAITEAKFAGIYRSILAKGKTA